MNLRTRIGPYVSSNIIANTLSNIRHSVRTSVNYSVWFAVRDSAQISVNDFIYGFVKHKTDQKLKNYDFRK